MVRPECQPIADELYLKQADRLELYKDRAMARTYLERSQIAAKIRVLNGQIDGLESDLRSCEGLPPIPSPLASAFSSTLFAMTDNTSFPVLGPSTAASTLTFSQANYTNVELTVPTTPMGTFTATLAGIPLATNTLSAVLQPPSGGTYEMSTGHVTLPSATFVISHSSPFLAGSSATFAPLTTRSVSSALSGSLTGVPVSATAPARLILVGSTTLVGGSYAGIIVDLIIDGFLAQVPSRG